jgi:hypothetical protein
MSITTRNTTWLVIRPRPALLLLLSLLLGGSTLKGTNATNIFMSVWSNDQSMKRDDCIKTITNVGINQGSPTLVDDAIGSAFTACIAEGSDGTFMNIDLDHNTGTNLQMRHRRMLRATVEEVTTREEQQEEEEEGEEVQLFFQADRGLTSCPPGCGAGSCGSNCNVCCLFCGIQQYCGGQCPTCPPKKRPSSLTFDGEMATTMFTQSTMSLIKDGVKEECLSAMQMIATKLNQSGNMCLGNSNTLTVTPIFS